MINKESKREKLEALAVLERLARDSKLSEEEIEEFSVKLGRKINRAVAERYRNYKK